jgi:hypothetical protein
MAYPVPLKHICVSRLIIVVDTLQYRIYLPSRPGSLNRIISPQYPSVAAAAAGVVAAAADAADAAAVVDYAPIAAGTDWGLSEAGPGCDEAASRLFDQILGQQSQPLAARDRAGLNRLGSPRGAGCPYYRKCWACRTVWLPGACGFLQEGDLLACPVFCDQSLVS